MIFFTSPPPSSAGIYPTPPHNNTAQRSFAEIARYSYNTDMHFTLNISKTVSTILPMNNTTNELTSGLRRSPGPSCYCILIQLPQREPQYSSLETPLLRSVGIQQLTIYPSDTTYRPSSNCCLLLISLPMVVAATRGCWRRCWRDAVTRATDFGHSSLCCNHCAENPPLVVCFTNAIPARFVFQEVIFSSQIPRFFKLSRKG